MRSRFNIIIIAALTLIALLIAGSGSALAQQAITIESVNISLWPEFDRASTLVIYSGNTASIAQVELAFNIPAGAEINAVAYVNDTGGLNVAPYRTETDQILMTSPNGSFHIEFYEPLDSSDGNARTFSHTFNSGYEVQSLTWEIQQPANAENFTVSPGGTASTGLYGLTYSNINSGSVEAGTDTIVSGSYDNPGGVLSQSLVQAADTQPDTTLPDVAPTTQPSGGGLFSEGGVTQVIVIILLVAVILGVAAYALQHWGVISFGQRDRGPGFCGNCGTPSRPGDHFCRVCGEPLDI